MSRAAAKARPRSEARQSKTEPAAAPWWIIPALVILTFVAFAPVLRGGFVNFDDPIYVRDNAWVLHGLGPDSIAWAFSTFHTGFWIPLTWLSFMLDSTLFGPQPWGYHFSNLLLHAANAVLLYLFLRRLTSAALASGLAAALFAIHPLRVESVAWITERKDVLSAFFGLLALLAYTNFAGKGKPDSSPPKPRPRHWIWYAAGALLLALSLMAKPMLVTFPLLLLLLDFWPLNRWESRRRRIILENVPLFALVALFGALAFWTQREFGAVRSFDEMSFGARIANAFVSYVRYLGKLVWFGDLAVYYPPRHWPAAAVAGSAALLAGISLLTLLALKNRPALVVGWWWFVIALLPVIGLTQAGKQSMADRFSYFPSIGLAIVLAALLPKRLPERAPARWTFAGAAAGIIVLLSTSTWITCGFWHDSLTIFSRALQVTAANDFAHNNLGTALAEAGRLDEAANHYEKAIEISPHYATAQVNLARTRQAQGRTQEAIREYELALSLNPNLEDAHTNLGVILAESGKPQEAMAHYRAAIRANPHFPEAHVNLGIELAAQGQPREAEEEYERALQIDSACDDAHLNLAALLLSQHKYRDAAWHCELVLRRQPATYEAQYNLAAALWELGDVDGAIEHFQQALRLRPDDADVRERLARAAAVRNR